MLKRYNSRLYSVVTRCKVRGRKDQRSRFRREVFFFTLFSKVIVCLSLCSGVLSTGVGCEKLKEYQEQMGKSGDDKSGSTDTVDTADTADTDDTAASKGTAKESSATGGVEGAGSAESGGWSGTRDTRQPGERKYVLREKNSIKEGEQFIVNYNYRMINRHTFEIENTKTRRGSEEYKVEYKALSTVNKTGKDGNILEVVHEVIEWKETERQKMPTSVVPPGTKIKISLKKGRPSFNVMGRKVSPSYLVKLMPVGMVKKDGTAEDKAISFLPEEPQAVGASWKLDPDHFADKSVGESKRELVSGEGRFVAITRIGEVPCFEVEYKYKIKGGGFLNLMEGVKHFKQTENHSTIWRTVKFPMNGDALPVQFEMNRKGKTVLRGKAGLKQLLSAGGTRSRVQSRLLRGMGRCRKANKYEAVHTVHHEHHYTLRMSKPETKIQNSPDEEEQSD